MPIFVRVEQSRIIFFLKLPHHFSQTINTIAFIHSFFRILNVSLFDLHSAYFAYSCALILFIFEFLVADKKRKSLKLAGNIFHQQSIIGQNIMYLVFIYKIVIVLTEWIIYILQPSNDVVSNLNCCFVALELNWIEWPKLWCITAD